MVDEVPTVLVVRHGQLLPQLPQMNSVVKTESMRSTMKDGNEE
jgi:hypothetical protein